MGLFIPISTMLEKAHHWQSGKTNSCSLLTPFIHSTCLILLHNVIYRSFLVPEAYRSLNKISVKRSPSPTTENITNETHNVAYLACFTT